MRSTKALDFLPQVDSYEPVLRKLAELICHADYVVLFKTEIDKYSDKRLMDKSDDCTSRPSAKRNRRKRPIDGARGRAQFLHGEENVT